MKVNSDIQKHILQCVEACELQLYGTEYIPGSPQHKIRIYIDTPNSSIGADDCQRVGQYLRDYASVHCPFLLQSLIEVSSPGLDRILFTLAHCKDNIGKKVRCKLKIPVEERKNFTGVLQDVTDQTLSLALDQNHCEILWDNVERIRIIYQPESKT
ncbi:MAG: hypothetical protein VX112_05340 [Pseudomonadota bacterium]|nr:hypothetical protein [Pseudomonadota bacterium]